VQIIYDINFQYIEQLKKLIGNDYSRIARMSIIEEGQFKVRARSQSSCRAAQSSHPLSLICHEAECTSCSDGQRSDVLVQLLIQS
jgi:hypothetical protein